MNNYYQVDFAKLKLGGYFRKSSESEDKQALSIESQISEGKRNLANYKITDYAETYQESKSAKEQGARIEFLRMEKDILSGKIDAISCWKLDRLARNMIEGGKIIDWLSKGILKCIITHDKVWYPTDNVLAMAVEFGQGKQFLKDLSVNVKRGNRTKAEGGIPNGVAFIGYTNYTTPDGKKKWIVDEEKFTQVQKMIREFLKGIYSGNGIAKYARETLILTTSINKRKGGKAIHPSGVHRILHNPILYGNFIIQDKKYILDTSLPRYCSEVEFEKIQRMLGGKNIPKEQKHEALFSQILKGADGGYMSLDPKFQLICDCGEKFPYLHKDSCPSCRKEIIKMISPKYLEFRYYYNGGRKKKKLPTKTIEEKKVLGELQRQVLNEITLDEELLHWSKKFINELKVKELEETREHQVYQDKKIKSLLETKGRVKKLMIEGALTPEEHREEVDRIENELKEINFTENTKLTWDIRLNEIIDLGQAWQKVFNKGNIKDKREVLNTLGTNLVWDEEKLIVHNDSWLNVFISGIKNVKLEKEKYEPKINPYEISTMERKIAPFEDYRSYLLSIIDDVRTLYLEEETEKLEKIKTEKYKIKAPLQYV